MLDLVSSISYYPNKLLTRDKIWKFLSFIYLRSHLILYDFPSSLFQVSSITNGSNISEKIHSDSFTEPVGNVPTILVGKRLSLNGIACNSLNDPSIFSRNFRIWRILSKEISVTFSHFILHVTIDEIIFLQGTNFFWRLKRKEGKKRNLK